MRWIAHRTARRAKLTGRAINGRTVGKERKTDPCVVLETAVLDRVNRNFELRGGGRKPVEDGVQPDPLGARPHRQNQAIEGSEGPRSGTGSRKQRLQQLASCPCDRSDASSVLVVECRTQRRGARAADIVCLGNCRHQCRQCDVDREMRHAEPSYRLAGHRYRLDIGGRAFRTDQLAADLADLPLGPDLGAFDPQHLAA